MYHRLPRELRNRIYSFCVQGSYNNEVIVRRAAYSEKAIALLTREYLGQHSYRWVGDPINSLISAQNLGYDVAQEMLESYYWTRTFKVSHRELSSIAPFLKTDRFGLGIVPAYYVRRLCIQIQPGAFGLACLPEARHSEEERCLQVIENLGDMLTVRTEVVIDVNLAESFLDNIAQSWSSVETDILSRITGVVNVLQERGLRVRMTCNRIWDG